MPERPTKRNSSFSYLLCVCESDLFLPFLYAWDGPACYADHGVVFRSAGYDHQIAAPAAGGRKSRTIGIDLIRSRAEDDGLRVRSDRSVAARGFDSGEAAFAVKARESERCKRPLPDDGPVLHV